MVFLGKLGYRNTALEIFDRTLVMWEENLGRFIHGIDHI